MIATIIGQFRPVRLFVAVIAVAAVGANGAAQGPDAPTSGPLTLRAALEYAVQHYPTIKAAMEETNALAEGVRVAKAGSLPRLDAVWQVNRATANNIFGQLLPQSVIPAMSGPVLTSASGQNAWGSVAGALFSWEPFDFGLRDATVRNAELAVTRARADEALTRLDVETAVGTAFLNLVAAEQAVVATQADMARRDVLARAAHTLADNQLRPGADASRADAERAAAQTRFIQSRQAFVLAQATLTRVLGVTTGLVTADATTLLLPVPETSHPTPPAGSHPFAQVREVRVDQARADERVLAHMDRPRVYLQSSLFARGSGANPDRDFDGGLNGLGPERANWATGIQVVFPNLFDFATLRARRAASAASTRAQSARYDEALLTVTTEQQASAALLNAARAVAANTPVQLAAAQESETRARARYDAGLASVVEVAEAQNLLAQAEYQHAVSRIEVWRAMLAEAVAQGDLTPLVAALVSANGAR
jgi:outer membrane protein